MNHTTQLPDHGSARVRNGAATAAPPPARRGKRRRPTSTQWAVALFAFLWSWSDFVFAGTLVNGGAHEPITLGIYHYIGNNNQEWNAIMATAVVASLPAAVILVLAQRYVAAGVTAGAVKD